eukprot:gene13634-18390_t
MVAVRYGGVEAFNSWFWVKMALVALIVIAMVISAVAPRGSVNPAILSWVTRLSLLGIVIAAVPPYPAHSFSDGPMTRTIKVDLFTDVVCPWCLVGSARLDQAIAALPDDVVVEVENHPFYLDPTTPPEGYDVGEMLRKKYGRDPKEMWARVESEAAKA